MTFTVKDIESLRNTISDIKVMRNEDIVADAFIDSNLLAGTLEESKTAVYDFDVFLPSVGINLQRPYVWTTTQQSEFLISIMQHKPMERVILIEYTPEEEERKPLGKRIIQVIDGKQRLTTIKKFLQNEIYIWFNDTKVYYRDFDKDAKMYFTSRIRMIRSVSYYTFPDGDLTDLQKIRLFNFYNFSGTPQTREHKERLLALAYGGDKPRS